MHYNKLTPDEAHIIIDKGTEAPFSGEYDDFYVNGIYLCRQCNTPLYRSTDKFKSGCGWPSFDDEIEGRVRHEPDADGRRTEILCATCDGHLGHVFHGEQKTKKNTRHCVNSLSIRFISIEKLLAATTDSLLPLREKGAGMRGDQIKAAVYAAGCFWGVQHHLASAPGVLATQVGYTGGTLENPTYEAVCKGNSGHAEACLVIYDNTQTDYKTLTKLFFEIHDPTQLDRQGPDNGSQYRSEIFYVDEEQKAVAKKLIAELKDHGFNVVTKLSALKKFWPAEDYHQYYYAHKDEQPYCHVYSKRFDD